MPLSAVTINSDSRAPLSPERSRYFVEIDKTRSAVIYDTVLRSKKNKIKSETELDKRYKRLFEIVDSNAELNEHIINEFYHVKHELENIERERALGIILWSKVQWTEEGEKDSSYFLRLKKIDIATS